MTDSPTDTRAHWRAWLDRWDAQQTGYIPDREARFALMLDVVEEMVEHQPVVLDLACGPGSISQRVVDRFPDARCVAVDADPALLHIGQQALGDLDGRLTWILADVSDRRWIKRLAVTQVDAVLSATATHWLDPDALPPLYQDLRSVLRPGGVYLNADHLPDATTGGPLDAALEAVRQRRRSSRDSAGNAESWEQWWDALAHEPDLADDLAARDHIGSGHRNVPTFDDHVTALRDAGFTDVRTISQDLSSRTLVAC